MVRVLAVALILFLASFSRLSFEDNSRHGVIEHRAVGNDRTTRISEAVRARFALDGEAAKCNMSENLYAYRALLDHCSGATRQLVEAAAEAGRNAGRMGVYGPLLPQSDQACTVAVDRLRAADDELLAMSEVMSHN